MNFEPALQSACYEHSVSPPPEPEKSLIRRARDGDEHAVEELVQLYAPRVLRFGMNLCKDEEDARDVMQDTLIAAARSLRSFKGTSRFSTWLYAIARSFCVKRRTRGLAPRTVQLEDNEADLTSTAQAPTAPDQELMNMELATAIKRSIRMLPMDQREVLVLRDIEGLTAAEVAEVLGLTVEAVKSRLHRARRALRDRLTPFLADDAPSPECPDVVELLSRHQEGDVTQAVCKIMEAHVAGCMRCARRCDSLRTLLAACNATPEPQLPGALQERLREEIRRIVSSSQA